MCRYEERLAVSVTNLAKTSLDADRGLKVREQFLVEKNNNHIFSKRTKQARVVRSRVRRMTAWSSS